MNDDSDRARTIFFAALELPSPDAIEQHLAQACAGDGALRGRVEELLADHRAAVRDNGRSDVAPDESTAPHALLAERPGTVIGGYKLLQQIGEGGMGVVFMAEQSHPIQRTVALKIIKPGMDSRQIIARFSAERQALAVMDHPNIARVLDAGATESGRPYFVMELVKGLAITEYCDAHRLTPRQRLQLFVPVCQAVQHAHQKGVIHRDLKPSNVLVAEYDSRAVPKIIDFGVAKAVGQRLTEHTLFTQYGQIVGTFEYMSPEQAKLNQLDVDTRSDIYSLGVLLYELLAGSTPFERKRLRSAAFEEILRIICEEDPPRPSTRLSALSRSGLPGRTDSQEDPVRQPGSTTLETIAANRGLEPAKLSGLIRGELDWIVMKCLEKERSRRYETANGLAGDLERYMNGEAVLACPPSAAYKFRKFARRNKAALAVSLGVVGALLTMVIGLATSNRLISAALDEKNDALRDRELALAAAKESAAEAEAERIRAEQQRERAEDSLTQARTIVARMLSGPAIGQGQWSELSPDMRRLFAAEAIKYYETLVQEGSAEPSVRKELARGYRAVKLMFQRETSPDGEGAEDLLRKSIEILQELLRESPGDPLYRQQLAWSLWVQSIAFRNTRRTAEAEANVEQAAALYEGLLADAPGDPNLQTEALTIYGALASDKLDAGRDPEAEAIYRRLLAIYEQSVALRDGSGPELNPPVVHVRRLATLLVRHGRSDEALAESAKAIAWDADNSAVWMWAAALHLQVGDDAGYRRICRDMLDRLGDLDNPQWLERTAKTCALAPGAVDDPLQIVALADRAIEGNETHPYYWNFLIARGVCEYRAGHDATAIHWLQRTTPIVFRAGPWDATIYAVLAMSHHRLGSSDQARDALEGARIVLEGRYPPGEDGGSPREAFDHDWMNAQILYREAVATLAEPAPSAVD